MAGNLFYLVAFLILDIVTCTDSASPGLCPDGSRPVQCFKEPCFSQPCPKHPVSICKNDYCGGCSARFYVNGTEVTNDCNATKPNLCPDGSTPVQCLEEPCRDQTCPRYPGSICKNDYCGGCNARFFLAVIEVTDVCNAPKRSMCPDGSTLAKCFVEPCRNNTCPKYPRSICKNDYCGGCNAKFFVGGVEVTDVCSVATSDKCPDGSDPVNCKAPPCLTVTCPKHPGSVCVNDYCKGCYARFSVNGSEVTDNCRICSWPPVNQCPEANRKQCNYNPCQSPKVSCNNIPQASCFDDFCGGCYARWFLPDCTEVTSQCEKRLK